MRVPKRARYRLTIGTSLRGDYRGYESPYGEIFASFASVVARAPVSLTGTTTAALSEDSDELVFEIEDFEAIQEFQTARGDADPEAHELGSDQDLAMAAAPAAN